MSAPTMRSRWRRALSAVFLAALLLVPLAASAHHHTDHAARPCAVCVVAQRTPALGAPGLALPPAVLRGVTVFLEDTAPQPRLSAPARTERGPPLRSSTSLV
jgi:hypothetical protein